LGEIVLPEDDEFEFEPFAWTQTAAIAHAQALQQLADLKARVSSEKDTIAKLNAQLDDFIKTKNETETAMLQQFMELLNEKKRKIRDQSRLLAGAKVDKTAGKFDANLEACKDLTLLPSNRRSVNKSHCIHY
jgi:septal ring factor EnvC (AmiA/AmiB activator)